MIEFYTLSVLVFVIFLVLLVYKDRKRFERQSVLLIRKTKRGRKLLTRLGQRFPKGWKIFGFVGIIITFYISVWGMLFLIQNIVRAMTVKTAVPGLMLLLPSPTQQPVFGPGFFAVPFWYWIISLALLIVVHEGAHGIMAVREKIPIKSLGWGLFLVLPLAFVEPDEKLLQKKKALSQLRVFAVGSFSNFILAFVCILIMLSMSLNLFMPSGIAYSSLIKDYPAAEVNMTGDIIMINNYQVRSLQRLNDVMESIGPEKPATILTTNGTVNRTFTIVTAKPLEIPEYKPDVYALAFINLEHILPGSIDFYQSLGKFSISLLGGEDVVSWSTIKYDINTWSYIEKNYPALSDRANGKIDSLEKQLQTRREPGYIGISSVVAIRTVKPELGYLKDSVEFLFGLLFFMVIINFGVGVANMLPIKPLDGGRMWEVVFKKFVPRYSKRIVHILGMITLLLILMNFALPFMRF